MTFNATLAKTPSCGRFASGAVLPVLLQAVSLNRLFWSLVRAFMAFTRRETKEKPEQPEFPSNSGHEFDWYTDGWVGGVS